MVAPQAGAAEHALDKDPERARVALRAVRTTAQEAIGELHTLVRTVRSDAPDARHSQPKLAGLPLGGAGQLGGIPDVVLMDIRMPALDGIEATRRLATGNSRSRVCMLTTYGIDEHVYDALQAGAAGFLVQTDPPERIVAAVRALAEGGTILGPKTIAPLIQVFLAAPRRHAVTPDPATRLTDRESEVLNLLATGHSNAEIARHLYIGYGTVKTHVARILTKLGVHDRVQAAIYAHRHGLVPSTSPPA